MTKKAKLKKQRADLIRQAEALHTRGVFADAEGRTADEARASFDALMEQVSAIDVQLRTADETPAPVETTTATEEERDATQPAAADEAETVRAAETARVLGIQRACREAGLEASVAETMIARTVNGRPITLEAARAALFEQYVERSNAEGIAGRQPITTIRFGEDARDKWLRGASTALLVRAGSNYVSMVAQYERVEARSFDPAEFRGYTLVDFAREALERQGVKTRGLSRMEIAGLAMSQRSNYQTPSDFPNLLETTMNKVMRAAYAVQPDTWSRWCGKGTTNDFRTQNWYRLGALSSFDALNDLGEFVSKSIPDAEKSTFSVATKGNIIGISRQTIVNDDLGFVVRLTEMMGRAGKLTIERAAYALLAQNSGLGPTQSDSQALFHSNRSNVGTGAALTAAALDADRVVMRSQTTVGGVDYADLSPAVLLVPVGLGGQARVINDSPFDPDATANKAINRPNVAGKMFRDIVDTPRISGTRRYLFADPSIAPVFLVSFLEGQEEPVLESRNGWSQDGVELKGRLDVGVDAVDYRGAVTNAGA